jgi:iron complex outermembrane receptor protein
MVNADSYRSPANTSATWTKTLPFATINWQPKSNWSFYGQYAQGMYVPDLSSFYTPSYDATTRRSSQRGRQSRRPAPTIRSAPSGMAQGLGRSGRLYHQREQQDRQHDRHDRLGTLVNIGTVHYKGVEGQIAYMPIEGLTLFGNGSYNYAHSAPPMRRSPRRLSARRRLALSTTTRACACPSARSSPARNMPPNCSA